MSIRSTRYSLIEQVLRVLSSYNRRHEEEIHPLEVGQQIDQTANNLAKRGLLLAMSSGDGMLPGQYLYTATGLNVLRPTPPATGEVSVVIPVNYLNLPFQEGVYQVYYTDNNLKDKRVASIPAGFDLNFSRTMTGNLEKKEGYSIVGQSLVLKNLPSYVNTLNARFVVAGCEALSDDAPYPVHSDLEDEVINRVVQFFAGTRNLYKQNTINSPEGFTPGK